MISTFICLHCGKEVPRNHHIKRGQKYCSAKECQRARKREWDKERYNSDETYNYRRLSSQKIWRKKRPSHEYQKNYRKMHPEYVNRNRELQRNRNKKRKKSKQKDIEGMIVNTDALFTHPLIDGTYALMQVTKGGKIVNTDTLMVRMQIL
jgi:molecular chaperone GrpE (heat shock protein)